MLSLRKGDQNLDRSSLEDQRGALPKHQPRRPFTRLTITDAPPEIAARFSAIAADLAGHFPGEEIRYGGFVTKRSRKGDELACEVVLEIEHGGQALRAALPLWADLLVKPEAVPVH